MANTAVIEGIEKKVARLIEDNRKLRGEREKLDAVRERLRDENRRLEAKAAELERRVAVLELREGFAGQTVDRTNTKAARARVNRLMREVDRCIALLNREGRNADSELNEK